MLEVGFCYVLSNPDADNLSLIDFKSGIEQSIVYEVLDTCMLLVHQPHVLPVFLEQHMAVM